MRYLTLVGQHPTICIDQHNIDRASVLDAMYYADKFGSTALLSNYKNPYSAKWRRREDTGEILLSDIPKRLAGDDLMFELESMLRRGKDTKPRNMHPHSLANLRPRKPFSSSDRPQKPPKITKDQLLQAKLLREAGLSWRAAGDRLSVKHESLRSALRRQGSKAQTPAKNSSQKQG